MRPVTDEHGLRRIFSIDTLDVACSGGRISITGSASTNSGGWSDLILRRLSHEGGVLTYEAVAKGPEGPAVSMMVQMFMLKHEDDIPPDVTAIRVVAEQNEMTSPVDCAKR